MSLFPCDIPDAVDRPLSALTLILLNIANGSDRFWLIITEDFAKPGSSSVDPTHLGSISSSLDVGRTPSAAPETHLTHRGVSEDAANSPRGESANERHAIRAFTTTYHSDNASHFTKPATLASW